MGSQEGHELLSPRGRRLIVEGGHSVFHEVLEDIYQTEKNPNGILSLGLAENKLLPETEENYGPVKSNIAQPHKRADVLAFCQCANRLFQSLMHDELLQYIHETFKISAHYLMYGDGSHGSKRLRAAVAHFVNRHFNPVVPVESRHIRATLGVSNANEMLAFILGDEGDGFLIGRPYYGAFVGDFWARAMVKTVAVSFGSTDPFGLEAVAKYEEKLVASNKEGVPIKALVLCTPNNPLGRCYSREVIVELMKLCQKYKIHLISDEIYALSVWDNPEAPNAPTFTSVLSIDTAGIIDPALVHAMWGMSKDFGANGLRLGCIIDQHNASFRESLRQISLANYPAGPSDQIAATILENDGFADSYIATNRARIAANYAVATAWLKRQRIPYAPGSNAGFFVWVDVRARLGEGGRKAYDHELFKRLLAERKVSIADALGFGGEEAGWFRIVFTHPQPFLEMGFARLEEVFAAYDESAKAAGAVVA